MQSCWGQGTTAQIVMRVGAVAGLPALPTISPPEGRPCSAPGSPPPHYTPTPTTPDPLLPCSCPTAYTFLPQSCWPVGRGWRDSGPGRQRGGQKRGDHPCYPHSVTSLFPPKQLLDGSPALDTVPASLLLRPPCPASERQPEKGALPEHGLPRARHCTEPVPPAAVSGPSIPPQHPQRQWPCLSPEQTPPVTSNPSCPVAPVPKPPPCLLDSHTCLSTLPNPRGLVGPTLRP